MLSGSINPFGSRHSQEARRNPVPPSLPSCCFSASGVSGRFSAVCRGCADCTEHPYSGQETVRGSPADPVHVKWRGTEASAALERVKAKVSPKQFQIFDYYVLREWDAAKVRRQLGVTIAQEAEFIRILELLGQDEWPDSK